MTINTVNDVPPQSPSEAKFTNGLTKKISSLSITSELPKLKKYTLPKVGEYFNVHVTMAPNPGNFKVSLTRYIKCLDVA